jgi:hypothetical protein
LEFFTRPEISENGEKIENFTEILSELQNREACHGSGDLYASYTAINFQKAQQKALEMQAQSPIAYGPFIPHGTNCSRFVLSVLLAGQPNLWHRLALRYFNPLTATPALNVRWLLHRRQMPKPHPEAAFIAPKLSPEALRSCLPAPEKPAQIPQNALWLAGEGAGSWFALNFDKNALHLQRYSPSGKLECSGIFRQTTQSTFDDTAPFQLSYPSDCQTITILQQQQPNVFTRE